MSQTYRGGQWDRRTGFVASIPAGRLTDAILGRALIDGDAFSLSARAWVDDGLTTPTAITGADAVGLAWSPAASQWAAELPYVSALNALDGVRVIVTLTAGGVTHDLMDASFSFRRADGR